MTLSELLSNEDLRLREFPVARDKIFLAHGGDAPLPRRVADAIARYATEAAKGDQERVVYPAILDRGRQLQERNILFCLDAIQTLGAFPLDVPRKTPSMKVLSLTPNFSWCASARH